jgi:hypothetical protein
MRGLAEPRLRFDRLLPMGPPSIQPNIGSRPERHFLALGAAAAYLWRHLPPELQRSLFERVVVLGHQSECDESRREQLAKFLHGHHARTHA